MSLREYLAMSEDKYLGGSVLLASSEKPGMLLNIAPNYDEQDSTHKKKDFPAPKCQHSIAEKPQATPVVSKVKCLNLKGDDR